MLHHYPTPDAEGIAKTKDLYLNQYGKTLTEEEAYQILFAVMRFLYLINNPLEEPPCSATPSTPENPMTTPK